MGNSESHRIRPAGRHILTIGRDLIQDQYAAIVELVKNAYDADSPDVIITFTSNWGTDQFTICIEDHGHGMSKDTVINKWLVPSTDDKLQRRMSPGGRIMQGRKGVGRYAASVLGNDLLLETVSSKEEKTSVYVEWSGFESTAFLEDVEILVDTTNVKESSGTRLTITGDANHFSNWDKRQFDKLIFELKKLKPPVSNAEVSENKIDKFDILLTVEGFEGNKVEGIHENIEPYPIFDLYDYRIAGKIGADGKGSLKYSLQRLKNTVEETIPFDNGAPTGCGELIIDIRVYDREPEAIESLIAKGLKDESGNYVGKNQAKNILNDYNGIGVYRNGFRIRPLGDADFDWLKLNEQRINNPSLRISSNQVIGYVQIQSEEQSSLIEKSARDGLHENLAFERLKKITTEIINKLEIRRLEYRRKAGLSRPVLKVERELERLFAYDELKKGIRARLTKGGIDKDTANDIIQIISKEEEEKNRIVEEIRQAIAVYQGQATLGKIINVILHEGRRPLSFFKNQIPNLNYWFEAFKKSNDTEKLEKFLPIAEGIGKNADIFVKLFSRLDPLASGKRPPRKKLRLKKVISDTFHVFSGEMNENGITFNVAGPDDFLFSSWEQDLYAIFTNLIDNSIYWMCEKKPNEKKINVDISVNRDTLEFIDYRDTGPGIDPELILKKLIFEPQFSTKPVGTGLGLAIAGEAASRNDLELKAFESEEGAYFRLQPKTED